MDSYQNYERIIQNDLEESLSKIINKILDNTVVLDVGCSSGMLGRYLTEKKNCIVDGIDIDPSAIELCRPIYRQTAVKNLEVELLADVFKAEEYDYIVIADVIEHLSNPDRLLSELKMLLKPEGTVIFSVPNITHISVGFELLFGKFKYRANGLLDSTHLRFYSKQSLLTKLESFGFYAWEVDTVQKEVYETEFSDHLSKFFPTHWKNELISYRDDALTYQWIVSVKTYRDSFQGDTKPAQIENRKLPLLFSTTLFWVNEENDDFSEERQLLGQLVSKDSNGVSTIDFYFSKNSAIGNLSRLRIDPVSEQKPFFIIKAEILDPEKKVVWSWTRSNDSNEFYGATFIKLIDSVGCLYLSTNSDPQWLPYIEKEQLSQIEAGWTFRLCLMVDDPLIYHHLNVIQDELATVKVALTNKELAFNLAIDSLKKQNEELTWQLNQTEDKLLEVSSALSNKDIAFNQIANSLENRSEEFAQLNLKLIEKEAKIRALLAEKRIPFYSIRRIISSGVHKLWLGLPISIKQKQFIRDVLYANFPQLFNWSKSYQNWHNKINKPIPSAKVILPESSASSEVVMNAFVPLLNALPPQRIPVRLIAFYLPQFHAITENNLWWGEGFTEWTNVMPAQPQFEGHYQPHKAGDLGYYNLLDRNVQHKQIELAKLYGIGGFCFYTYWFNGQLLLEKPVENYLHHHDLDLPFCLCWANENWSRRWDGLDSEILIAQNHSAKDDVEFIKYVSKYMLDERYIRINGRPLLLVYRPSLLPSAKKTANRWREWCNENGLGEIYLAYTQSFETVDPNEYGFDAAIEFPPNNSSPPDITETIKPLCKDFGGTVYDWRIFVERSGAYKTPTYTLFRGVCPSWDNTARRKNLGTIFLNSSPEGYEEWLANAVDETCARIPNPEERLIFVNAWNEWAEGAHLEPDQKYGYAYLDATRNALTSSSFGNQCRQIIIVSHDAHPHGAQYLALNLAKVLSQKFGFKVHFICLGAGILIQQFAQYARVYDLSGLDYRGEVANLLAKKLKAGGCNHAIVNTTASGFVLETLKVHDIKCISLVHEMRGVLEQLNLQDQAKSIAKLADKVVFAAKQVADEFRELAPISDAQYVLRPQGLYKRNTITGNREYARQELRKALQLAQDTQVVLGVGYADYRKGIDLFVEAGKILVNHRPDVYFVWLGHWPAGEGKAEIEQNLACNPQIQNHFIFPGRIDDTDMYYAGADVYALTSREDPFPSVVLEAMDASLPVVGFEGVGGCTELMGGACGKLVPAFDVKALSSTLNEILSNHEMAACMGEIGKKHISERFSFRDYVFDLLYLLDYPLPRISVVVPNYNYACFLQDRIKSIEDQNFPIFELIILDDCSTDESVKVIETIIERSGLDIKFVCNDKNSGSVFSQWRKGVEIATGDLIWIAEADDLCEQNFLAYVIQGFEHQEVVLSYCESKQIDSEGKVLCNNYLDYVADIGRERWQEPYVREGNEEIADALSVKNTIPNVSAVVFKREILKDILQQEQVQLQSFKVAGDWFVYTKILEHGSIAFTPHSVNLHRRHRDSVTNASLNLSQLNEIVRMQREVAATHEVSEYMQVTARIYAQKLYEQFGLASSEFPSFEHALPMESK